MVKKVQKPKQPSKGVIGNFKKIQKVKGKGAVAGALQNKSAKRRGKKVPFGGGKKK